MKYILFAAIYLLGETIGYFMFKFIRRRFEKKEPEQNNREKRRNKYNTIAKGLLERFFIYISLANGLPHVLTLLGALKIGTRLNTEKQHAISNDYFLIGNLVSILLALLYFFVYDKLIPYLYLIQEAYN
ncbi:hypothetical protein FVR03_17420 [Pontibacter qinzhouensis]|uniref:Uncharacterized protein n=1 Tax=Pontibacter qinzhouensis TaxID=2603253 RepID=A0A5C8JJ28_9BACT|nr:hypothetical protein [Pontibacter qinzhouensis]TXK36587.1 hypothetical protein FVR03_17420 [Pontibacter qinzhouensis]